MGSGCDSCSPPGCRDSSALVQARLSFGIRTVHLVQHRVVDVHAESAFNGLHTLSVNAANLVVLILPRAGCMTTVIALVVVRDVLSVVVSY